MQAIWSEHWHVVRGLRPRLRDGVEAVHRRMRGRTWVLLIDPLTQRFHRLEPRLWQVLRLFDGRHSLDEVWQITCSMTVSQGTQQDLVLTQNDLVQLLGSLHANDLLQTQVAPDAAEALERHERQAGMRLKQAWLNPLNLRFALLHPDLWFERHVWLARKVVSWPALTLWLCVVLPAAVLGWQHAGELTENLSDRVLAASNIALLWLVYPCVKAVHELAHGLAVKAFGGQVREIGLMFMVFTPVPYVDATSSYRFPSKWARMLVAAAGIMAELLLGALALYVWLSAQSGLVTAVAFNVVFIAGVSTLLINGNPLMRYDGYFIACDLLEVPNLAQRSSQYWAYLMDRYAFGSRDALPPLQSERERWLLVLYGLISPLYRLTVTFGLVWFVASEYLFVGAVMAIMAVWSSVLMPLWKGWRHLRVAAALARRRDVALRRSLVALLLCVLLLGALPVPFYSVHQAVVWVPDEALVRAESAGLVRPTTISAGAVVALGERVMQLDNPVLAAERAAAEGQLAHAEARMRDAEVNARAKAESLRGELWARKAKLSDAQARVAGLDLHARTAGRWVPRASTEMAGRYVKRGEVVGYIVDAASPVLRAAIPQEDMDLIRSRLGQVEVRMAINPRLAIPARLVRQVPGGEFELVSPALGTTGGGEIAVDPSKAGGTHSLKRTFDIEIRMDRPSIRPIFGDRAHVRFDLGTAPLAWQWYLRLRQLFLARLSV